MFSSDPDLIYEKCVEKENGFQGSLQYFPPDYSVKVVKPELSGELCSVLGNQISLHE